MPVYCTKIYEFWIKCKLLLGVSPDWPLRSRKHYQWSDQGDGEEDMVGYGAACRPSIASNGLSEVHPTDDQHKKKLKTFGSLPRSCHTAENQ